MKKRKELIRKLQREMFVNEEDYNKKLGELKKGIENRMRKLREEVKELKDCIKFLNQEKWIKWINILKK